MFQRQLNWKKVYHTMVRPNLVWPNILWRIQIRQLSYYLFLHAHLHGSNCSIFNPDFNFIPVEGFPQLVQYLQITPSKFEDNSKTSYFSGVVRMVFWNRNFAKKTRKIIYFVNPYDKKKELNFIVSCVIFTEAWC